jgi:hypothetical protein
LIANGSIKALSVGIHLFETMSAKKRGEISHWASNDRKCHQRQNLEMMDDVRQQLAVLDQHCAVYRIIELVMEQLAPRHRSVSPPAQTCSSWNSSTRKAAVTTKQFSNHSVMFVWLWSKPKSALGLTAEPESYSARFTRLSTIPNKMSSSLYVLTKNAHNATNEASSKIMVHQQPTKIATKVQGLIFWESSQRANHKATAVALESIARDILLFQTDSPKL